VVDRQIYPAFIKYHAFLVCLHPGGTLRRPLPAVILRTQGNVAACQSALLEKPAYSLAVVDVRPEPPAISTDL
jgi:hypothetical protein